MEACENYVGADASTAKVPHKSLIEIAIGERLEINVLNVMYVSLVYMHLCTKRNM